MKTFETLIKRRKCEEHIDIWDELCDGCNNCETLNRYTQRLLQDIPKYPEIVIEDWLWRHHNGIADRLKDEDYFDLNFEKIKWNAEKCIKNFEKHGIPFYDISLDDNMIPKYGRIYNNFKQNGTWTHAPIYFYSKKYIKLAYGVSHKDYLILEGHHRISIMKKMIDNNELNENSIHEIWIATK